MLEITEADKLLTELFMTGKWDHSFAVSTFTISEELADRITSYLIDHRLIGAAQENKR